MELIDREALIEAVNIQLQNALDVVNITGMTLFKQEAVDCKNFIALIKEMPTVEPPKGEWKKYGNLYFDYECSLCGRLSEFDTPFCQHCGARMKGE